MNAELAFAQVRDTETMEPAYRLLLHPRDPQLESSLVHPGPVTRRNGEEWRLALEAEHREWQETLEQMHANSILVSKRKQWRREKRAVKKRKDRYTQEKAERHVDRWLASLPIAAGPDYPYFMNPSRLAAR